MSSGQAPPNEGERVRRSVGQARASRLAPARTMTHWAPRLVRAEGAGHSWSGLSPLPFPRKKLAAMPLRAPNRPMPKSMDREAMRRPALVTG